LKRELSKIKSPLFKEIRGRGLFVGVELKNELPVNGSDFAKILCGEGLLTKSTHDYTIRLAPPLVITSEEVKQAVEIVAEGTHKLEQMVANMK
jgi:ornithine--oxo-acid transaminase